jgi:hypothetical protein
MLTKTRPSLPDVAIEQINSLGGPPLPAGVSLPTLKVIMENIAASEAPTSSCRVALSYASRRR